MSGADVNALGQRRVTQLPLATVWFAAAFSAVAGFGGCAGRDRNADRDAGDADGLCDAETDTDIESDGDGDLDSEPQIISVVVRSGCGLK